MFNDCQVTLFCEGRESNGNNLTFILDYAFVSFAEDFNSVSFFSLYVIFNLLYVSK